MRGRTWVNLACQPSDTTSAPTSPSIRNPRMLSEGFAVVTPCQLAPSVGRTRAGSRRRQLQSSSTTTIRDSPTQISASGSTSPLPTRAADRIYTDHPLHRAQIRRQRWRRLASSAKIATPSSTRSHLAIRPQQQRRRADRLREVDQSIYVPACAHRKQVFF